MIILDKQDTGGGVNVCRLRIADPDRVFSRKQAQEEEEESLEQHDTPRQPMRGQIPLGGRSQSEPVPRPFRKLRESNKVRVEKDC